MNQIVDFIQKESLKIYRKKYSKKYIKEKLLPIINYINLSSKNKFLIGGAQGIGKSSLIKIIKNILEKFYGKKIISLSLDNYYLSKNDRLILAQKQSNLLITRGVPGTHQIKKLLDDINKFDKASYPIITPLFDKLIDDTLKNKNIIKKKADILILEGWCCGCEPIEKEFLFNNSNYLERKFDKNHNWRNYYNNKLKNEYKKLFKKFDNKIFIKAPSFKYVLSWRLKQELNNTSKLFKSKKMNIKEIKIFIQHYEKITKWMLKDYTKKANLVIRVDKNQRITSTRKIKKKSIF